LSPPLTHRHFANHIDDNDPAQLSCGDLKTHSGCAGLGLARAESYMARLWRSTGHAKRRLEEEIGRDGQI
jgi:hypothetical protein